MKPAHPRDHQPKLRTQRTKLRERPYQPVQILVRMQSRDRQKIRLRLPPLGHREESRVHSQRRDRDLLRRQAIEAKQIVARRLRVGQQMFGPVRRSIQKHAPEGQVEPAKVLRLPLVLQVVKHRHAGAGAKHRRREARIEQHVHAMP